MTIENEANAVDGGANDQENETNEANNQPTLEELLEENKRLKAHNEKVLGEKKLSQSELAKLKKEREDAEIQKMTEKEDYKGMLEKANQTIESLQSNLSNTEASKIEQSIKFEVQRLAKDAVHIEDVIDKINISSENIDKEKGTVTDLAEQIDALRKSRPKWFETKVPTTTQKIPGSGAPVVAGQNKKPLKTIVAEKLANL